MTANPAKIALVTGAGSGIGRACATALARDGSTVIVTDVNLASATETAGAIRALGGMAEAMRLDISVEKQWTEVTAEVSQHVGPVQTLVNNAALKASVAGDNGLLDSTIEAWDEIIRVNLRGPMLGTRALLPGMMQHRQGCIIMISSAAAVRGVAGFATAYSTAKAGLGGLVRAVSTTYGANGVRCNGIAPGVIEIESANATEISFRSSSHGLTGRAGKPLDIGSVAAFLASDAGSFINGQMLLVDGGLTAHMPGISATQDNNLR